MNGKATEWRVSEVECGGGKMSKSSALQGDDEGSEAEWTHRCGAAVLRNSLSTFHCPPSVPPLLSTRWVHGP